MCEKANRGKKISVTITLDIGLLRRAARALIRDLGSRGINLGLEAAMQAATNVLKGVLKDADIEKLHKGRDGV